MWKFCKRYAGLLFLALTFAAILFIASGEEGIMDAWGALRSMDPLWEAVALLLWAAFIALRGYTMMFFLSKQGLRVPFATALKASIIGLFYSGITPAASGGQPMQMYHLRKAGVPVSVSASGVMVKFVGFQSMLLILAAVFLGCNFAFVSQSIGGSMWLVGLGFVLNAVVMASVFLIMINRRVVMSIARFFLNLGEKTRLIKDRESVEGKIRKQIEGYIVSLGTLRDRPFYMLAMFALSGLQVLTYCSILWALYNAFGLRGATAWQLIALQLLLYQTVSFVPLPGAAGAQEGVFYLFLQALLPAGARLGVLFAWRFFTFYLTMLLGAGTIVADSIMNVRRRSRDKVNGSR